MEPSGSERTLRASEMAITPGGRLLHRWVHGAAWHEGVGHVRMRHVARSPRPLPPARRARGDAARRCGDRCQDHGDLSAQSITNQRAVASTTEWAEYGALLHDAPDLPFCVSLTSRCELSAAPAGRREALLAEWDDWAERAQSAAELPAAVVEMLVRNAAPAPAHPDQLAIPSASSRFTAPFVAATRCAPGAGRCSPPVPR
jgi:hypothetical protein